MTSFTGIPSVSTRSYKTVALGTAKTVGNAGIGASGTVQTATVARMVSVCHATGAVSQDRSDQANSENSGASALAAWRARQLRSKIPGFVSRPGEAVFPGGRGVSGRAKLLLSLLFVGRNGSAGASPSRFEAKPSFKHC